MHYYTTNVNDFNAQALYLSFVERGIYGSLCNRYYQTEQPLPADIPFLCEVIGAKKAHEKQAVASVLRKMFVLADGVYTNAEVEKQIAAYKKHVGHSKVGGRLSALSRCNRTEKLNPPSTALEPNSKEVSNKLDTYTPITPNGVISPNGDAQPVAGIVVAHSGEGGKLEPPPSPAKAPIAVPSTARCGTAAAPSKPPRPKRCAPACPDGVSASVWSDYLTHRGAKRAAVTATVLAALQAEAALAGISLEQAMTECVTRGWIGFKAEWYHNATAKRRGADAAPQPTPQPAAVLGVNDFPQEVSATVWVDYLAVRATKGAALTRTTLAQFAAEADKAGVSLEHALTICTAKGWLTLKAEWLQPSEAPSRRMGSDTPSRESARGNVALSIFKPEPSGLKPMPKVDGQLTETDCPQEVEPTTWQRMLRFRAQMNFPTTSKTIEALTRKAVESGYAPYAMLGIRSSSTVAVW